MLRRHISDAVAQSGIPFLDLAANQIEFAKALQAATGPAFEAIGLELVSVTVQNVSLPEELQKILDQRIGMGMVGNEHGPVHAVPDGAGHPRSSPRGGQWWRRASPATRWAWAGVALGQTLARARQAWPASARWPPAPVSKPDDIMATLEKLGDLKAKGILTDDEFAAKKADLLKSWAKAPPNA